MAANVERGDDDATFKLFEGIYNDYQRKLNEAWDASCQRIMQGQKQYTDAGAGTWASAEEAQKAFESARDEYVAGVRGAWEESQKAYSTAYEQFVRAFRDAWAKLPAAELSPLTLSAIGQSAIAAAGLAGSSIGNWALVAWAGVPHTALAPESPRGASAA